MTWMCARYTLRTPADLLAARFGLPQVPDLLPRYNVSPTQPVPVIGTKAGGQGRGLALFRWGFIPPLGAGRHPAAAGQRQGRDGGPEPAVRGFASTSSVS